MGTSSRFSTAGRTAATTVTTATSTATATATFSYPTGTATKTATTTVTTATATATATATTTASKHTGSPRRTLPAIDTRQELPCKELRPTRALAHTHATPLV